MSETKEPKIARKGIFIAVGIICITLVACLGGVVATYTLMINDKSNTISSLKHQIAKLNSSVANLRNQVASNNSTINSLTSQLTNLQNQLRTVGVNQRLGLRLTMTLQKTTYSLGEPINITLTLTNISNQTTSFGLGPAVNEFDYHVYNDTNSNIYWHSSIWLGAAIPQYVILETLNAGESLNCTFVWQQTFSHSLGSEAFHVSPGTYYIVGSIGPPFFFGKNSTMETTPIQITIS